MRSATVHYHQFCSWLKKQNLRALGGGQVVSMQTFYSEYQTSNPDVVYNFFSKIVVKKKENKQ